MRLTFVLCALAATHGGMQFFPERFRESYTTMQGPHVCDAIVPSPRPPTSATWACSRPRAMSARSASSRTSTAGSRPTKRYVCARPTSRPARSNRIASNRGTSRHLSYVLCADSCLICAVGVCRRSRPRSVRSSAGASFPFPASVGACVTGRPGRTHRCDNCRCRRAGTARRNRRRFGRPGCRCR